jgi:hypothetical protein
MIIGRCFIIVMVKFICLFLFGQVHQIVMLLTSRARQQELVTDGLLYTANMEFPRTMQQLTTREKMK